jgi:transposase
MDTMISLPELKAQNEHLLVLVTQLQEKFASQEKRYNKQLCDQNAKLESQALLITKQAALIKHYESQLLLLKRRQFGSSSERSQVDLDQLSFFADLFGNTGTKDIVPPPETEEITYKRKKRKGKREEDLLALPVVRVDYKLSENEKSCPVCETTLQDTGKPSIRREIEIIPAQAIVKEHAVYSYACDNPRCEGVSVNRSPGSDNSIHPTCPTHSDNSIHPTCPTHSTHSTHSTYSGSVVDNAGVMDVVPVVIKPDAPKPLISGSLASPSLVAHIAYQKYSNGMPLYRIEKGFQYDGVIISRQNMSNWVIKCSQIYLMSIYERLKYHLMQESVLHSDGTTVQVLREEGRAATTKSCEWVYRTSGASGKKIVLYEYTQTKGQEHPKRFLANWSGYLHTDGAQTYHNLPPDITIVGCWAHARRYFENIVKSLAQDKRKDSEGATGLAYINALFKLEREYAKELYCGNSDAGCGCGSISNCGSDCGCVDLDYSKRHLWRTQKSKPIADDFFTWAGSLGALPQSPLGKAVHYALSQRKYLENIFLDGRCELSNNRALFSQINYSEQIRKGEYNQVFA